MSDTTMPNDEELRHEIWRYLPDCSDHCLYGHLCTICKRSLDNIMGLHAKALHEAEVRARNQGHDPNRLGYWIFLGDREKLDNINDLYWSYVNEFMAEADPWSASHNKGWMEYVKKCMPSASFGEVGIFKTLAIADQRAKERIATLTAEKEKKV